MSEPKEGKQIRYGFFTQAAFATPAVDTAAFYEPLVEPFDIDRDIQSFKTPEQHGSRNSTKRNLINSTAGAAARFTTKGPFSIYSADFFAYAHTQKMSEGAGTTYAKTATMFTTHPAFEDDEGFFLTWMKRFPVDASSHKIGGCIAPKIKISGVRDEMIMLEMDWIGNGAGSVVADPPDGASDAWVNAVGAGDDEGIVFFGDISAATVAFNGGSPVDVRLKSFEFMHQYKVEKIGHDGTDFSGFGLYGREGTFQLVTLKDTDVDAVFSNHSDDDTLAVSLTFDLAGDNAVTLAFNGKLKSTPKTENEGILGLVIEGEVLAEDVDSEPFTLTITNSTNRSWIA